MWYSKKTEPGSSEGKAQQGRKQDMIKQSIRIFCVEEIYDMVRKKEYSKDFLEYVKSAPNNIKEWLRKIGVDESLPEMRYIAEPEVHSAGEPETRSDAEPEVHSAVEIAAGTDAVPESVGKPADPDDPVGPDARSDSDIDVLILLDGDKMSLKREMEVTGPLNEIEWQTGVLVSPTVMLRKQWENMPFKTPFYINVMNEGIRIF